MYRHVTSRQLVVRGNTKTLPLDVMARSMAAQDHPDFVGEVRAGNRRG
jgi:hypothetical protein